MANKETTPLLRDALTSAERVMLGQLTHAPGFSVLTKLFDALCKRVNDDTLKLDPEEDSYERKLSIRTQRARNINEGVGQLRDSVNYHTQVVLSAAVEETKQAEEAVQKTFGIYTVPIKKKVIQASPQPVTE
jgi:hypothetical protein